MFSAVIRDTRVSLRHTSPPKLTIEQKPNCLNYFFLGSLSGFFSRQFELRSRNDEKLRF
jgi:hypothetical protein